jgi:hypothetical protein
MSDAHLRQLLARTRDLFAVGCWDENDAGELTCAYCQCEAEAPHDDACAWANLIADIEEVVGPEYPCDNCGDGSGWARTRIGGETHWGACADCNDDGEKPKPPYCSRCDETFPFCHCPRAEA